MNDEDRTAEFIKAEKEIRDALKLLTKKSIDDAIKLLTKARKDIELILNGTPTEWELFQLTKTKAEIARVLKQLETRLAALATSSSTAAWQNGLNMLDKPLTASGMINVVKNLPFIDITRIGTNQAFMLDRLTDIPKAIIGKINAQLGAVSIGATTRYEAIKNITKLLNKGGKSRATAILNTELGRMQEIATHERRKEVAKKMPGVKKEWRKSGKKHSRLEHDKAHGQTVKVDDKFIIGGAGKNASEVDIKNLGKGVEMDHPRDPKAPAKQVINCGCWTRTRMDHWKVKKEK